MALSNKVASMAHHYCMWNNSLPPLLPLSWVFQYTGLCECLTETMPSWLMLYMEAQFWKTINLTKDECGCESCWDFMTWLAPQNSWYQAAQSVLPIQFLWDNSHWCNQNIFCNFQDWRSPLGLLKNTSGKYIHKFRGIILMRRYSRWIMYRMQIFFGCTVKRVDLERKNHKV